MSNVQTQSPATKGAASSKAATKSQGSGGTSIEPQKQPAAAPTGMRLRLHVWRQSVPDAAARGPGLSGDAKLAANGRMVTYELDGISPDMSFLEMLDVLNERLEAKGEEPVAFEHDCREGICGSCGMVINGVPHGPEKGTATCQLHMRSFTDGQEIYVEPWRAKAFPVRRDLVVDRSAFDRIVQAGAYISVNTGAPRDANSIPVDKADADAAFDAATCIGCGACVAACKNASAMLFVGAKVSHFSHLPQGHPERTGRVLNLVEKMDEEGFGNCTNQYECHAACPKEIPIRVISEMNREYSRAVLTSDD